MATAEFYIVFIKRKPDVSYDAVKEKMDKALDWYRIDETFWVLYTTTDAEKWYGRLSEFVKDSGSIFICKLDVTNRQGWMSRDFWNWIRREGIED
jgi:hypothetical protein